MVSTLATDGGLDSSRLFRPPMRWGWEFVRPRDAELSPERLTPPQWRPVRMVKGLQRATWGVTVAAVVSVELIFTEAHPFHTYINLLIYYSVGLAMSPVGFWAGRHWWRSVSRSTYKPYRSGVGEWVVGGCNAIMVVFFSWLVLPIEAVVGWFSFRARATDLIPDAADQRHVEAEFKGAVAAWQERIGEFEFASHLRHDTCDVWYPIGVQQPASMICVFGGTYISWSTVLYTAVPSMLGSGARIVIGDLSRRRSTDKLVKLCRDMGIPVHQAVLPHGGLASELLGGLSWKDLSTLLAEVLHSAKSDLDVSLRERQEDRAVIRDVAGCLDLDGDISVTRLRQAFLVVEGVGRGEDSGLTLGEYDKLASLYNDVQRHHGGVMERVARIERALRDFVSLDAPVARQEGVGLTALAHAKGPWVRVVGIDKDSDDLDNRRLKDLVFQLLLRRRVRVGSIESDVLVILGADGLGRAALESLATQAHQENVMVILFFESLREEALDVVGVGGAAAGFFALGNNLEAEAASKFIGEEYRWEESQHTRSSGSSLTKTFGQEASQTSGSSSDTQSHGTSFSKAFGESQEYSEGEQRVREAVTNPEELRGLAPTQMIYVEVGSGGRRVAKTLDCNPQITFAPRVAHASWSAIAK